MTENIATNQNFTRLCRCCASEHNLMYDIFWGTCSNAQKYHEVVMECAPVQLFRDDGLTSLVCRDCVSILESFVAFRRKCIESETILKQMSSNISSDEQETLASNREKQDTPMFADIKEELNDIDETTKPETEFDDPEKNSVSGEYPEPELYELIKIENTIVNENWPDRDSQVDISDPLTGKRLINKPYSCDKCGKPFSYRSDLKKHQVTHTDEKPYSCDRCDKSFNIQSNLNQHRTIHADEKPYSCDRCDKSFNFKSNLKKHQRVHAGDYSCGDCDETFSLKSNYNRHRRTHRREKPFACDRCDKSFKFGSVLRSHQRIHTGERPYTCGVCGKSFNLRSNYNRHQKTHAGDKTHGR